MRSALTSMGVVLSLVVACQPSGRGHEYDVATVAFPEGDRVAGREAFITLGCSSCHRVAWDRALPAPVSASPGPELSRLGERTAGVLATSIISPSHHLAPESIEMSEDGLSPMGDFTETMTVRQLVDVVAYLRFGDRYVAQGEPEPASDR